MFNNIKYTRWERQKEVLLILNGNSFSVKDLSDYLDIDVKHADFLLRHYHKSHLLKRKRIEGKFYYTITNEGLKQLKWLENGKYLEYIENYNDKYKNDKEPLNRLEKVRNEFLEIVALKNKLK